MIAVLHLTLRTPIRVRMRVACLILSLLPPSFSLCNVHECPDHEDNLILDLAAEVGAMLIVSNDSDLISMSPWRGTPILMPTAFTAKVAAMRRHARRRNR